MFAFLAAIVPIAGSLFAAVSVLVEQSKRRSEQSRRRRISARVDAMRDVARGLRESDREAYETKMESARELERTLLDAGGLPARKADYGEVELLVNSVAPASAAEHVRQWVLIWSALIGVVLLALDAM